MQNENLDEYQASLLESAYEATNRLYRLNQSLIMLSRIENREFHNGVDTNLASLFDVISDNLKEQFGFKNISVGKDLNTPFIKVINMTLAEIMVQNLLSNALRYTPENGEIKIESTDNSLLIKNSGPPLAFSEEKIFHRFVRSGNNSRSLGIGLSLVKKIADIFSMSITYHYEKSEGFHVITIS
jgi:signal transduction histidine kinase